MTNTPKEQALLLVGEVRATIDRAVTEVEAGDKRETLNYLTEAKDWLAKAKQQIEQLLAMRRKARTLDAQAG